MAYDQTPNYIDGKRSRLRGEPITSCPFNMGSQNYCDWRSGWMVADSNKSTNPKWSDAEILA